MSAVDYTDLRLALSRTPFDSRGCSMRVARAATRRWQLCSFIFEFVLMTFSRGKVPPNRNRVFGANSLKSSFVFSRFVDSIADGSFVSSFLG
jgi:hypothetical protein